MVTSKPSTQYFAPNELWQRIRSQSFESIKFPPQLRCMLSKFQLTKFNWVSRFQSFRDVCNLCCYWTTNIDFVQFLSNIDTVDAVTLNISKQGSKFNSTDNHQNLQLAMESNSSQDILSQGARLEKSRNVLQDWCHWVSWIFSKFSVISNVSR